tara:strand:- start:925 stop:1536 length:612 start_codon:yes stop_codon:yes gene_type:complete
VARSNNSLINYLSINENFPVAGQDNDTQVFRDNTDTIKTSLRNAKDELTDVLTNAAYRDEANDFELNNVSNAVLINNRISKFDGGAVTASPTTIDYKNGDYQIYRVGGNISIDFLNFPGDPVYTGETTPIGMGKVTLELYSDGSSRTVNFLTSSGTIIKSKDFPGYASGSPVLTLTSATDPVIVEVFRHSTAVIYMRYIGAFA